MKRKLKKIALITLGCVVAIFTVWRLHLAYSVSRQLGAVRAAGLPTNGDELNRWWARVPDAENAALPMMGAFDLRREFPLERAKQWSIFQLPRRTQPLTEEQRQFLADYVALNSPALARVDEALRLPKCRYPMDFSFNADPAFAHLVQLLGVVHLSQYEGYLAVDSHQPALATACIARILGLARTLDDEPTVHSQSLRNSYVSTACDVLQRCLATENLDEEQSLDLISRFTDAEKTGLMTRALIGERAWHIPDFLRSHPEDPRIAAAREQGIEIHDPRPWSGARPWWLRLSGLLDCDLRHYLTIIDTNIALLSLGPPRSLAAVAINTNALGVAYRRFFAVSATHLPSLGSPASIEASGLARMRVARTALAIERFRRARGGLPEKLDDLVPQFLVRVPLDPFDGEPLRYRRLPKGHVIYSVDRDGRDDGGREWRPGGKSGDEITYDLTFTVER